MQVESEGKLELTEKLADKWWRMNNLYYIVNEKGERVRFQANPVQRQLYRNLWYLNIVLKSRQHGMTTFFCLYNLDECLFNDNIRAGIIAHTRDDAEAFFQDKVRYAYDQLPESIRQARPARSESARELSFNNNSKIRVGTSMRGATLQLLHISEFGKICSKYPEKAREIITGSLNTVHSGQFVSIESTAEGNEGRFFELCQEAKKIHQQGRRLTPLDFRFHFFAWWQDDRNKLEVGGDGGGVTLASELESYFLELEISHGIHLTTSQKNWYAKKWIVQGTDMKREHPSTPEEAFEASIEGAYFSSQFARIYKEDRITIVPYTPGIPVHTAWDLGMNDTTAIWFYQLFGQQVRVIDFYENSGEGLGHYATTLRSKPYEEYGTHWAPHDIEVRELGTGKSRIEQAREYGLNFKVAPKLAKQDQIESARGLLAKCWFDESKCNDGIRALENYRKEWDDKNSVYRNKPLHNWASNPADAFQVLAVAYKIPTNVKTTYIPKRRKIPRDIVSSAGRFRR